MRLLNTHTLELATFIGIVPHYAILSHRWEAEELTFQDIAKSPISDPESLVRTKLGFSKVTGTCALAARDGFDWVWIDSLCIDKASSSELQEAINSMFNWYVEAQLCYAFLSDVPNEDSGWSEDFEDSLWFTWAWTLQELIAPRSVEFYAADWSPIGTRQVRYRQLSQITGIASDALIKPWSQVEDMFLAAQKLSWAAHRHASRGEDAAYSLLGLFDVHMPMLYGEGESKAFLRLQKAIYKKDGDHSLFLFRPRLGTGILPLFGDSMSGYCQKMNCRLCSLGGRGQGVYHDISYSTLSITGNHHGTIESDHFIRVVRNGVMVKLPTTKLKDVPSRFMSSAISKDMSYQPTEVGADLTLAILNLKCHGQGIVVIPLHLQGSEIYHRQVTWPTFLSYSFSSLGIMSDRDPENGNMELADAQIINTTPITDERQIPLHQASPARRLGNRVTFLFSDNASVHVTLRRLAPPALYPPDARYRLDVERK